MADGVLDRIEVRGFASISDAAVSIGPLTVLIGANGAGKSNLIRAFEMLGRIVDEDLQLFVRKAGSASAILTADGENALWIGVSGRSGEDLVGYRAQLAPGPEEDLFFVDEQISFRTKAHPSPWSASLDHGHRETRLHRTIEERGRGSATARAVVRMLQGCRVFHFHDTSADAPVKKRTSSADNLALRPDAANLAPVLKRLQSAENPVAYRRIVGAVQQVAPFLRDFVLEPETNDQIRLRWRQNDSDAVFSANQLSDGTLRFICLAALLLQPELPNVVVLDEPELGLHPFAIVQLAAMLRQASARSQVIVATQSVTLMSQFGLDEVVVVDRGVEGSAFSRPDAGRLQDWLDEYSLGELWEKNLIGGRPGFLPDRRHG